MYVSVVAGCDVLFPCVLLFIFFFHFFSVEQRLLEEIHKNDVLIIVGETGSGKTTRKCL